MATVSSDVKCRYVLQDGGNANLSKGIGYQEQLPEDTYRNLAAINVQILLSHIFFPIWYLSYLVYLNLN